MAFTKSIRTTHGFLERRKSHNSVAEYADDEVYLSGFHRRDTILFAAVVTRVRWRSITMKSAEFVAFRARAEATRDYLLVRVYGLELPRIWYARQKTIE